MADKTEKFRSLLIEYMPDLNVSISEFSESKLTKIMDLMVPRLQFNQDLLKHSYFFEDPDFEVDFSLRFKKKVMKNPKSSRSILASLIF